MPQLSWGRKKNLVFLNLGTTELHLITGSCFLLVFFTIAHCSPVDTDVVRLNPQCGSRRKYLNANIPASKNKQWLTLSCALFYRCHIVLYLSSCFLAKFCFLLVILILMRNKWAFRCDWPKESVLYIICIMFSIIVSHFNWSLMLLLLGILRIPDLYILLTQTLLHCH